MFFEYLNVVRTVTVHKCLMEIMKACIYNAGEKNLPQFPNHSPCESSSHLSDVECSDSLQFRLVQAVLGAVRHPVAPLFGAEASGNQAGQLGLESARGAGVAHGVTFE